MNKQKIEQLKKNIESRKKEFQDFCHQSFKEGCKELFDNNSLLESISFKGYIPYFNDGDPCVFRSSYDCPTVNGYDEYDLDEEEQEELRALYEKVVDFLGCFDDDFYQIVFGSNFEVSITKDNIDVDEYRDHN